MRTSLFTKLVWENLFLTLTKLIHIKLSFISKPKITIFYTWSGNRWNRMSELPFSGAPRLKILVSLSLFPLFFLVYECVSVLLEWLIVYLMNRFTTSRDQVIMNISKWCIYRAGRSVKKLNRNHIQYF